MLSALEILKQLASIDSSEQAGELACASKIKEIFDSYSISSKIDSWQGNRANIEAVIGGGQSKALMFASHLDVVPVEREFWSSEPFEPLARDGKLYCRGAADMKGGIASVMAAMIELVCEGCEVAGDIVFVATAGEETDSTGAVRYLASNTDLKGRLAGVIVPEPTLMDVKTAHKGILWLKVTSRGKACHGSMPHLGVNAFENALAVHNEIKKLGLKSIKDDLLGSCSVSCNKVRAGDAINIVPDLCSFFYDIRLIYGVKQQDVIEKFKSIIDELNSSESGFDISLDVVRTSPALYTNPDQRFVARVCEVMSKTPGVIDYTTDSPYFAELGAPVVVIGPGEPRMCHQMDEYIQIDKLEEAKNQYKKLIKTLI